METHGQSHLKSETEGTSGSTKWTSVQEKHVKTFKKYFHYKFDCLTKSSAVYNVKWSFFVLSNQKKIPKSRRHLADDISSKIMFDENLTI